MEIERINSSNHEDFLKVATYVHSMYNVSHSLITAGVVIRSWN